MQGTGEIRKAWFLWTGSMASSGEINNSQAFKMMQFIRRLIIDKDELFGGKADFLILDAEDDQNDQSNCLLNYLKVLTKRLGLKDQVLVIQATELTWYDDFVRHATYIVDFVAELGKEENI